MGIICTFQRDITNLESQVASLTKEVEREKNQREEETALLKKLLSEQIEKSDSLSQELVDQQGENQLLKKKNLVALKVSQKHHIHYYFNSIINYIFFCLSILRIWLLQIHQFINF